MEGLNSKNKNITCGGSPWIQNLQRKENDALLKILF